MQESRSSQSSPEDVCVIIPCFNEEATVVQSISRVLELDGLKEVIVVDDASTDSSLTVISEMSDPRIRVVKHAFNQGKGKALRTGIASATADIVVIHDADLEYDPQDIPRLAEPIRQGIADVVYGSRFAGSDTHRVLYYWHSVGNRFLTTLSNMTTNLNLTDMETCYKAFRREVIQDMPLEENRFGFEPEVTAKVAAQGLRVF